jgi:hypothetical protein
VSNVTVPHGADLQAVARLAGISTNEASRAVRAGVVEALRRGLKLDDVTIVLTPTMERKTR